MKNNLKIHRGKLYLKTIYIESAKFLKRRANRKVRKIQSEVVKTMQNYS